MPDIVLVRPGETTPLDPTSSAFAHGFGLFETMRFADGRLYFWDDHWARLAKSAQRFALALPEKEAVLAALRELVQESATEVATLKLSLLKRGSDSRLYVYARPPIPAPESRRLLLDTRCPIFPRSLLAGHKTHNYMEAMHLLATTREQGFYDLLRVDADGFLAETTTANLFFVKDGRLHTPALATGILPGVTRAALLRSPGLEVEEGSYAPEVLLEAEAAFVTNATAGLQPVERIEGFSEGKFTDFVVDSASFEAIQAAFTRVREESARQLI